MKNKLHSVRNAASILQYFQDVFEQWYKEPKQQNRSSVTDGFIYLSKR